MIGAIRDITSSFNIPFIIDSINSITSALSPRWKKSSFPEKTIQIEILLWKDATNFPLSQYVIITF